MIPHITDADLKDVTLRVGEHSVTLSEAFFGEAEALARFEYLTQVSPKEVLETIRHARVQLQQVNQE